MTQPTSTPGEMVERVARAIWDNRQQHLPELCRETWEQGRNLTRWYALDAARAAIAAMREPTGIILQSAIVAHEACTEDGWGENAMLDAWQAAIDAALQDDAA